MTRLTELAPVFVEIIPDTLEYGKIYISEKFGSATWLCPCGCGDTAHIPFAHHWEPAWMMRREGDKVTFSPSIAMRLGCKSHYFLVKNKIQWC